MIHKIFSQLFVLINVLMFPLQGNQPVRLHKKESKSTFEVYCDKVAPYLILACTIILVCLIFIALVKYGANITGTEANNYYYHLNN